MVASQAALINKAGVRLAFQVSFLQAYNSVSLVSLLARLSQLVYSLDVWPSAGLRARTHTHSHLQVIPLRGAYVFEEQRQNVLDQVGRTQS